MAAIDRADVIVAVLDSRALDEAACIEMGYPHEVFFAASAILVGSSQVVASGNLRGVATCRWRGRTTVFRFKWCKLLSTKSPSPQGIQLSSTRCLSKSWVLWWQRSVGPGPLPSTPSGGSSGMVLGCWTTVFITRVALTSEPSGEPRR